MKRPITVYHDPILRLQLVTDGGAISGDTPARLLKDGVIVSGRDWPLASYFKWNGRFVSGEEKLVTEYSPDQPRAPEGTPEAGDSVI